MSFNINAMDLVFGIHSSSSPAFKDYRESDKTMRYLFNGFSAIGWIPVVGVIAGIARLIFTGIMHKNDLQSETMNSEAKAFYTVMIIRGVLETLSLGFLLVIPDLILSVGREIAFAPFKEMSYLECKPATQCATTPFPIKPKEKPDSAYQKESSILSPSKKEFYYTSHISTY